jgi:hypothetical protein
MDHSSFQVRAGSWLYWRGSLQLGEDQPDADSPWMAKKEEEEE